MFERVREFERGGARYTLYRGGSFTLFREEDDGAIGIGTIEQAGDAFAVSCWWHPEVKPVVASLEEALDVLVELSR